MTKDSQNTATSTNLGTPAKKAKLVKGTKKQTTPYPCRPMYAS